MSQAESSPSPTALRMKLTEIESPGAKPVCNRAVKKPFFPSKEYSPFSIVCNSESMKNRVVRETRFGDNVFYSI